MAMIASHPTPHLLRMVRHNPSCPKKGCLSVNPVISVILLWTSGEALLLLGTLFWCASMRVHCCWQQQTFPYHQWCAYPVHTFAIPPSGVHFARPSQTSCQHPRSWNSDLDASLLETCAMLMTYKMSCTSSSTTPIHMWSLSAP